MRSSSRQPEPNSPEELLDIIKNMCKNEDYCLSEKVEDELHKVLNKIVLEKDHQFANGRYVRNVFEDMIMNHARRVSTIPKPTIIELKQFVVEDIPTKIKEM